MYTILLFSIIAAGAAAPQLVVLLPDEMAATFMQTSPSASSPGVSLGELPPGQAQIPVENLQVFELPNLLEEILKVKNPNTEIVTTTNDLPVPEVVIDKDISSSPAKDEIAIANSHQEEKPLTEIVTTTNDLPVPEVVIDKDISSLPAKDDIAIANSHQEEKPSTAPETEPEQIPVKQEMETSVFINVEPEDPNVSNTASTTTHTTFTTTTTTAAPEETKLEQTDSSTTVKAVVENNSNLVIETDGQAITNEPSVVESDLPTETSVNQTVTTDEKIPHQETIMSIFDVIMQELSVVLSQNKSQETENLPLNLEEEKIVKSENEPVIASEITVESNNVESTSDAILPLPESPVAIELKDSIIEQSTAVKQESTTEGDSVLEENKLPSEDLPLKEISSAQEPVPVASSTTEVSPLVDETTVLSTNLPIHETTTTTQQEVPTLKDVQTTTTIPELPIALQLIDEVKPTKTTKDTTVEEKITVEDPILETNIAPSNKITTTPEPVSTASSTKLPTTETTPILSEKDKKLIKMIVMKGMKLMKTKKQTENKSKTPVQDKLPKTDGNSSVDEVATVEKHTTITVQVEESKQADKTPTIEVSPVTNAPVVIEIPVQATISKDVPLTTQEQPLTPSLTEPVSILKTTSTDKGTTSPIAKVEKVPNLKIHKEEKLVTSGLAKSLIGNSINTGNHPNSIAVAKHFGFKNPAKLSMMPHNTFRHGGALVDPKTLVAPQFRKFIYYNDAPEIVAAKIAFFSIQESLTRPRPKQ